MNFIINETGEQEELHYISVKTGVDCINDIIGNSGAIGDYIKWDEEKETYRINKADFEWWKTYVSQAIEDEKELDKLREQFDQRDEETGVSAIDNIIAQHFGPIDMESEHDEWQNVFKIIRETLGN